MFCVVGMPWNAWSSQGLRTLAGVNDSSSSLVSKHWTLELSLNTISWGWTMAIYQLFWCSQGYQDFDTWLNPRFAQGKSHVRLPDRTSPFCPFWPLTPSSPLLFRSSTSSTWGCAKMCQNRPKYAKNDPKFPVFGNGFRSQEHQKK